MKITPKTQVAPSKIFQMAQKAAANGPQGIVPKLRNSRLQKLRNSLQTHLNGVAFEFKQTKQGFLMINQQVLIAQHKKKFRLVGLLDWAYYTMPDLAAAIANNSTESYYVAQLSHPKSTPNEWKRPVEEAVLKTYYGIRSGRIRK